MAYIVHEARGLAWGDLVKALEYNAQKFGELRNGFPQRELNSITNLFGR